MLADEKLQYLKKDTASHMTKYDHKQAKKILPELFKVNA